MARSNVWSSWPIWTERLVYIANTRGEKASWRLTLIVKLDRHRDGGENPGPPASPDCVRLSSETAGEVDASTSPVLANADMAVRPFMRCFSQTARNQRPSKVVFLSIW